MILNIIGKTRSDTPASPTNNANAFSIISLGILPSSLLLYRLYNDDDGGAGDSDDDDGYS